MSAKSHRFAILPIALSLSAATGLSPVAAQPAAPAAGAQGKPAAPAGAKPASPAGAKPASPAAKDGAKDGAKKVGYDDTPVQPAGRWRIHDGSRPVPRVIAPGTSSTPNAAGKPPSDAIVLLGPGSDTSKWQMTDGKPSTWTMKGGILESGKGMIRTKDEFSDCQLHVEFATPKVAKGDSQGRGNSGVFLLGKFEIQVLDSYQNLTYPDGQAGAMYGQFPPLVNASLKPGEWQTYDIVFTTPRFKDGKLDKPAVATVLHNGIVVHNATPFWGPTSHKTIGEYKPDQSKGPIVLQDHGNPVHFRNIWLRPLKGYDEP